MGHSGTRASGIVVELDTSAWNSFDADRCAFDLLKVDRRPRNRVRVDTCNFRKVFARALKVRGCEPV